MTSRPRSGPAAFAATVIALAGVGVAVGTLWFWLAPATTAISTGDALVPSPSDPEAPITVDAWFVGLTVPVVLLATWVIRRRWRARPAVGAVLVACGALVLTSTAAAVGAWWGPPLDPEAARGEQVAAPLLLGSSGWLLVAPIAGIALWFIADLLVGLGFARDDAPVEPSAPTVGDVSSAT